MDNTNLKFDYKSIIESCGIQDHNIKKLLEQKGEAAYKIQEQLNTLNNLMKERDQKIEDLSKLKFILDKHLQKIEKTTDKLSLLKERHKDAQEEISQLKLEMEDVSDNFLQKITKMDNDMKALYSQFEGETLDNQLTDLHNELLLSEEREQRLQKTYDDLKQISDSGEYERPTILKSIFKETFDTKAIAQNEEKIATKKKNIQVLTDQYNKKMEMLQKLSK